MSVMTRVARRLRRGHARLERVERLAADIGFVPRADDDYWRPLQAEVARLTAKFSTDDWLRLRLHDRIAAWLVAEDHREDLVLALVDRSENGSSFLPPAAGRSPATPGYATLLTVRLPDWLLAVGQRDVRLRARIDVVRADDGGCLLTGFGYLAGARFEPSRDHLRLMLAGAAAEREIEVSRIVDPFIDAESKERWCSYAAAGIRAVLGAEDLVAVGADPRLELEVGASELRRRKSFPLDLGPEASRLPVLDAARLDGDALLVEGRLAGAEAPARLRLSGRLHRVEAEVLAAGDRFSATLPLTVTTPGRTGLPLEPGDYELSLSLADGQLRRVRLSANFDQLSELMTPTLAVRVVPLDTVCAVRLRSPLPLSERGRFNQRRLIESVRAAPAKTADNILATCFSGRSAADSVEPVARELAARLPGFAALWGVANYSVAVPAGFEPLLIHSRGWHEALRSSRYLINNAHFPAYFRIGPDQIYLQTWHGTPLKRIGADMPVASLSLSYRALMGREAAAWRLLLAQGPYAQQVLPAALGYRGEVLAAGYPRNDVLLGPGAATIRATVRRSLGLREEQLAVLYAPTWRDDARTADNQSALVSNLDAQRLRQRCGEDVVVLLRGHSNTARGRDAVSAPNLLDLTDYPNIAQLYLAADVLVTDYSSVMFDFCLTGKPMLFLTPDLDHYREATRGFYFDLPAVAPGPLLATTDELADWLLELPELSAEYADRYEQFVARFAPADDGAATRRVVDRLLAEPTN